jgi:peroxiredoxin
MTYLFLILAWSILAAILYPERFLVLASAAVVFIGFSIQTYRSIMKFVDNLQFEVERLIDEQIQSILRYTINKAKTEVRKTLQMKEIKA